MSRNRQKGEICSLVSEGMNGDDERPQLCGNIFIFSIGVPLSVFGMVTFLLTLLQQKHFLC